MCQIPLGRRISWPSTASWRYCSMLFLALLYLFILVLPPIHKNDFNRLFVVSAFKLSITEDCFPVDFTAVFISVFLFFIFTLLFNQYKVQEPLNVEGYWMVLFFGRKNYIFWEYAGEITVDPRLQVAKILMFWERYSQRSGSWEEGVLI